MVAGGALMFVLQSVHGLWKTAALLNKNSAGRQFLRDYGSNFM